MAIKTPPLNVTGSFTLLTPWLTVANTTYTCIAVRKFQDLIQQGVDIVGTYYTPKGLSSVAYQADLAAGASLITLASATAATIYVPDTYITAYPDLTNVAYSNLVISAQVGPIPDKTDLTFLEQQISAVISDTIGISPTVLTHVSESTNVVTQAQAAAMETSRQAAITNRTTDHAKYLAAQQTIAAQGQQIRSLTQLLVNAGLVPPPTAPTPTPAPDGTVASFTKVATALSVVFTDTSVPYTGFTITAWSWNFGDGVGVSTIQNPTYVYAAAGTFIVILTVTDSNGQKAVGTASITVT